MFDNKIHKIQLENSLTSLEKFQINDQLFRWGYLELPGDWNWSAVAKHDKYSGSFVKRVGKYLYNNNMRLKREHASELGALFGEICGKKDTYYFRFSGDDWEAGDFGDKGSCFWAERINNRRALIANGMKAIQFFRDPKGKTGYARALMIQRDDWIIFNAYGLRLRKIAQIMSQHLNLQHQKMYLCNHGASDESLYLNEDGTSYAITKEPHKYEKYLNEYSLDLKINMNPFPPECYCCGSTIGVDDGLCDDCVSIGIPCNECGHYYTSECLFCE